MSCPSCDGSRVYTFLDPHDGIPDAVVCPTCMPRCVTCEKRVALYVTSADDVVCAECAQEGALVKKGAS